MPLSAEQLQEISAGTLDHYQAGAAQFWERTREHDVSQNIRALLDALIAPLTAPPPWTILDLGCGPGRDLATFKGMGHSAVGIDGAPGFVEMARRHSGCEVWRQDLLALELPPAMFDGVYANAVLFHVPTQELPRVLRELHTSLKPGGVLFASNPHGNNEEGWNKGRYGAYHDLEAWRFFMSGAGFVELSHYYRPEGLPREQQPWLASVWRTLAT